MYLVAPFILATYLPFSASPAQSAGPVPDPEGLHRVPAGGGLLPGPGSRGSRAANAHAR